MQLVFIHGWAFDTHVWDALAAKLSRFKQTRVDLGYFGSPSNSLGEDEQSILIGHSLGFVHGIGLKKDWAARIAVNSFPNFVMADGIGCVTAATLRAMSRQLTADPAYTLDTFYRLTDAAPPDAKTPQIDRLKEGLDELRDAAIGKNLPSVPCLVLAAQNDPLVPSKTSAALAAAQAAQLLVHPTAGHMLPQIAPEWCASAITSFINKHFP